jgi:hypothetical protein
MKTPNKHASAGGFESSSTVTESDDEGKNNESRFKAKVARKSSRHRNAPTTPAAPAAAASTTPVALSTATGTATDAANAISLDILHQNQERVKATAKKCRSALR